MANNDPLHGITLEDILFILEEHFGWDGLSQRVDIRCFKQDPSIKSSLKFLRKTPWARSKVEKLYIELVANDEAPITTEPKPKKKPKAKTAPKVAGRSSTPIIAKPQVIEKVEAKVDKPKPGEPTTTEQTPKQTFDPSKFKF